MYKQKYLYMYANSAQVVTRQENTNTFACTWKCQLKNWIVLHHHYEWSWPIHTMSLTCIQTTICNLSKFSFEPKNLFMPTKCSSFYLKSDPAYGIHKSFPIKFDIINIKCATIVHRLAFTFAKNFQMGWEHPLWSLPKDGGKVGCPTLRKSEVGKYAVLIEFSISAVFTL